jgi:hypothetical protein
VKEEGLLLKILNNRCHSWIGHIIRHSEFVVNILEGAISGKKAMGRPRLQYLKQVARNIGADSYTAMKRKACNKSRWKPANQSKDWRRRRGRPLFHICFEIVFTNFDSILKYFSTVMKFIASLSNVAEQFHISIHRSSLTSKMYLYLWGVTSPLC